MNENDDNLGYIDLLVAFVKEELPPDLHSDIENTLLKDPVLRITIDGLQKLLDEHQGDKTALKEYFKDIQVKGSVNFLSKRREK